MSNQERLQGKLVPKSSLNHKWIFLKNKAVCDVCSITMSGYDNVYSFSWDVLELIFKTRDKNDYDDWIKYGSKGSMPWSSLYHITCDEYLSHLMNESLS